MPSSRPPLRGRLPNPSLAKLPRCGVVKQGCAFLTLKDHSEVEEDENATEALPWRQGLIISIPSRYAHAAEEARRGGFRTSMIEASFANTSRCWPGPNNWTDPHVRANVMLENEYDAYQKALTYVAESGVPHAIFEDDIVLSTSRSEIHRWLEAKTNRTVRFLELNAKTRRPRVTQKEVAFARKDFDMVPLGSCGTSNFACGHAMWFTPAGARALLAATGPRFSCKRIMDSQQFDPSDEPLALRASQPPFRAGPDYSNPSNTPIMIDLHLYIELTWNRNNGLRGRPPAQNWARVCSTLCAPNRTLTPECWDNEALVVVRNRNCTDSRLAGHECTRDSLRCVNWQDLNAYRGHGFPLHIRGWGLPWGHKFVVPRYHGYGHFVQDRWGINGPHMHGPKNKLAPT